MHNHQWDTGGFRYRRIQSSLTVKIIQDGMYKSMYLCPLRRNSHDYKQNSLSFRVFQRMVYTSAALLVHVQDRQPARMSTKIVTCILCALAVFFKSTDYPLLPSIYPSWWFQPIWKLLVKLNQFQKNPGEHIYKHVSKKTPPIVSIVSYLQGLCFFSNIFVPIPPLPWATCTKLGTDTTRRDVAIATCETREILQWNVLENIWRHRISIGYPQISPNFNFKMVLLVDGLI